MGLHRFASFLELVPTNRHQHWLIRYFIFAIVAACSSLNPITLSAQPPQSQTVDFFFDVAPIFSKRCFSCHGGEKPKGDFRIEDGAALSEYVVGKDLANSSLWTDYLRADPNDPESLMMPPKSEGGPLSGAELAIIRAWIEDGAELPEAYHLGDSSTHQARPPAPEATSQAGRIWAFIGYFHPAVVHLPLGLLLMGGLAAFLSFFAGSRARDFAFYCLVAGALGAIAAAVMGWSFAAERGYPSWKVIPSTEEGETFFLHRWLGVTVAVLSCLVAVIAVVSARNQDFRSSVVWRIGLIAIAALVGWVGHEGGELTHKDLFNKAIHRLTGTPEEEADTAVPLPPPDFEMRASF